MRTLNKVRLVLAGVLLGAATMLAAPNDDLTKEQKEAIYNKIKAQLDAEEITLEQAQEMWLAQAIKQEKEEAK
jgi:hypothetical protein